MSTGIRALEMLFLEVDNLEESLDFYSTGLGFKIDQHKPEADPPMATLRAGRLRLSLAQRPSPMSKRGRGIYFFITVDDVDEFYEFLVAGGIETYDPPEDASWGGRFFATVDPNGYRIFFVTWFSDGPYLTSDGEDTDIGLLE
jgi:catechol 2,3-dioxygenase-like lactoylglutathione lyase family enzyme